MLIPYLVFNGNCVDAIEYYKETLDLEVDFILLMKDAPDVQDNPVTKEDEERIMFADLSSKDIRLRLSDNLHSEPALLGNCDNVILNITTYSVTEAKSLFDKLKQEGNVVFDIQETFYNQSIGIVIDKYGFTWKISVG